MTGARRSVGQDRGAGRPLAGRRVLVTRPRPQAQEMLDALAACGAEPVLVPLIEVGPPDDPTPLEAALERLHEYDWVLFGSANAARAVGDRLVRRRGDRGAFAAARVCAVGPATAAALERLGIPVDLVPEEHRAEGVVAAVLAQGPVAGQRILIPRASQARGHLQRELGRQGAHVDDVVAYRVVPCRPPEADDVATRLRRGEIAAVTLTSPAAVEGLLALGGDPEESRALLRGVTVAVIGPTTRAAAQAHGLTPHVMPARYTGQALVEALCAYLEGGA